MRKENTWSAGSVGFGTGLSVLNAPLPAKSFAFPVCVKRMWGRVFFPKIITEVDCANSYLESISNETE